MRMLLLSGGVDSAVCLWSGQFDAALFVDYGQPAAVHERRRSQSLAAGRDVRWMVATVGSPAHSGILGVFDGSATSAVVPGRNSVFVGLAAMCGGTEITLGCNADDFAAFADCRPAVLGSVAEACGATLVLPLAHSSKRQVVAAARALGLPLAATTSCYRGTDCGVCAACILLAAALT